MKREEYNYLFEKLRDEGLNTKQISKRLKYLREEMKLTKDFMRTNKKDKDTIFKEEFSKLRFL